MKPWLVIAIMAACLTAAAGYASAQSYSISGGPAYYRYGNDGRNWVSIMWHEDGQRVRFETPYNYGLQNRCSIGTLWSMVRRNNPSSALTSIHKIGGIKDVQDALSRDRNGVVWAVFYDCAPNLDGWHGVLCIDIDDRSQRLHYEVCAYVTEP